MKAPNQCFSTRLPRKNLQMCIVVSLQRKPNRYGDSIRPCTNGVSLLHRIASVAPLSKPQTMY